jgi:hypothetical protein
MRLSKIIGDSGLSVVARRRDAEGTRAREVFSYHRKETCGEAPSDSFTWTSGYVGGRKAAALTANVGTEGATENFLIWTHFGICDRFP